MSGPNAPLSASAPVVDDDRHLLGVVTRHDAEEIVRAFRGADEFSRSGWRFRGGENGRREELETRASRHKGHAAPTNSRAVSREPRAFSVLE